MLAPMLTQLKPSRPLPPPFQRFKGEGIQVKVLIQGERTAEGQSKVQDRKVCGRVLRQGQVGA